MELSDETTPVLEDYDRRIRETFKKGQEKGKLDTVEGNFGIVVYKTAVWVVVTKGPRTGIYREMTEDICGFTMVTTPEVFEQMNVPFSERTEDQQLDHDKLVEENKIYMSGNPEIYVRFLKLGAAEDMLSLRASGSAKKKPSRRKRTRKLGKLGR